MAGTEIIQKPESRCLSGGILKGYQCDDDGADFNRGVRYSIQLLQDTSLESRVFDIPVYHHTLLDQGRSFVYLGEYDNKQQALLEIEQLVQAESLALEQWRPAVVEIDKSLRVPAIRLVQMYKTESYAYLAPVSESELDKASLTTAGIGAITTLPQYYTIQLASFKGWSGSTGSPDNTLI